MYMSPVIGYSEVVTLQERVPRFLLVTVALAMYSTQCTHVCSV